MERIKGTHYLTKAGFETTGARDLILRRRLQVLVHSCLYYYFDHSLVSDRQWQSWANELVSLQMKYPSISKRVDYHEAFEGFDGTTGFDLPITNPEIIRKAQQLLKGGKHEQRKNSKRVRARST